jgi:trimeric autotransporter adhesin
LKPRRHKSKRKTSIGQGPKKNLQITETSTYAISMDKLISDQMLQLADSMQSVKSNMTHSKGSLSEKRTDSSLKKLHDQATNEISQSAKGAHVYRETDNWSESGTSRLESFTRRSDKPIILSCCSSGRIPDLVVVHHSSERLSTGRISSRSLRDSVRSIDVIERVDSSRRYSPSNDRVYNTLQSKSTSGSFRDKQVPGILEEELNDPNCPSSDRFRHHPRQSGTSVGAGSYHRRSSSIEEMRDRIYSRSTTDRFINRTSDTSNEVVSSKFRSSSSTDSSRFQHRTLSISTEQLKAKLHSNLKPERLAECSSDLCSLEQLKMIRNSKITSKCISEEFASCPSNEHLEHEECLSSNLSECVKDSSITSSIIQKENKRSGSQTSSGVGIKRGSHSSTKPSNTNTRSTSKSSKRQSKRTPSTSTEKLRQSLRSSSRTSYRLQNRQSPSPISAQNVDKQMFASRTSAGVTHEHAPIISSELNKQLRQSSSTTCTTNTSIKKLLSLTNCRSVSDKQIPCTLVEQSKSRGRSRISSPRWTAENTTVEKVASAQIPPRTAMMKGAAKMSEGMIASKMANLNVLWSKDGADVGDREEQRRKIREFLEIGCEHIDRPLAPAKPNVVIVKQRELGVQTHYAITDSIIPLAAQSRGQYPFQGPREKGMSDMLRSLIQIRSCA